MHHPLACDQETFKNIDRLFHKTKGESTIVDQSGQTTDSMWSLILSYLYDPWS